MNRNGRGRRARLLALCASTGLLGSGCSGHDVSESVGGEQQKLISSLTVQLTRIHIGSNAGTGFYSGGVSFSAFPGPILPLWECPSPTQPPIPPQYGDWVPPPEGQPITFYCDPPGSPGLASVGDITNGPHTTYTLSSIPQGMTEIPVTVSFRDTTGNNSHDFDWKFTVNAVTGAVTPDPVPGNAVAATGGPNGEYSCARGLDGWMLCWQITTPGACVPTGVVESRADGVDEDCDGVVDDCDGSNFLLCSCAGDSFGFAECVSGVAGSTCSVSCTESVPGCGTLQGRADCQNDVIMGACVGEVPCTTQLRSCSAQSGALDCTGSPPVCIPDDFDDPTVCPLPSCPGGNVDTDGDFLLDCWETAGGVDFDGGGIDLLLPGADPNVPNVYVELDYMQGHEPLPEALERVVTAFANAGVILTIELGEELQHSGFTSFPLSGGALDPSTACTGWAPGDLTFDDLKLEWFGTDATQRANSAAIAAKLTVYRYGIMAHSLNTAPDGQNQFGIPGCAEVPGNDFLITLGDGWLTHAPGQPPCDQREASQRAFCRNEQEAILMHELGHMLGLHHGGDDSGPPCKPNYLSVMNRAYQNNTEFASRALDFSHGQHIALNEQGLSEPAGLGPGVLGGFINHGPPPSDRFCGELVFPQPTFITEVIVASAPGQPLPINWDQDCTVQDTPIGPQLQAFIDPNPVQVDVNHFGIPECGASPGEVLTDHDDWGNLVYDVSTTLEHARGARHSVARETFSVEQLLSKDDDSDGHPNVRDNCPATPNADQSDRDEDAVGDRCEDACLHAEDTIVIGDHSEVFADRMHAGSFFDLGANSATVGGYVEVRGDARLRSTAVLDGDMTLMGSLSSDGAFTVTGDVLENTPVAPLPIPVQSVTVGSANLSVGSNSTQTWNPGSYAVGFIGARSTVTITPGVYNFSALELEPDVTLVLAASGTVIINVQGELEFGDRSRVLVNDDGAAVSFYTNWSGMVRLGTDVVFEASLRAPNGDVHVYSRTGILGCLAGRNVTLEPDVALLQGDLPQAQTCDDGVQNGNETGIDCGGYCPSACCNLATYEAETMFHSTGGTTPGGWNIWSNGYIATTHDFTAGPSTVTVHAKGQPAAGVWPQMVVRVGGVQVGSAFVNSTAFAPYVFDYTASGGPREIKIEFVNDLYAPPADRNLLVDKASVHCN
jgi:hypothetical protein